MAVFTEIFLTDDINERREAVFNEEFPGKKVVSDRGFLEIRLSRLYGRSDQDYKRIKRNKKNSIFFNLKDYDPNYYYQDLLTTSQEEYTSFESHKSLITPFTDNKDEKNKKLKTFNISQDNARFSASVKKSLGTDCTVYFGNKESKSFSDIDLINISKNVIGDSFKFMNMKSTKVLSDLDYPYYVNDYPINKISSVICPFNTLDEIQQNILTLENVNGIKCNLTYTDIRNRNFLIKNKTDKLALKELEPYDDEGIAELLIKSERTEIKTFLLRHSQGKFIPEIDTENSVYLEKTSPQTIYLSDQKNNILPFDETYNVNPEIHFDNIDRVNINDNDILSIVSDRSNQTNFIPKDNDRYMSFGSDTNYEYSHGIDSIAFRGLMD